jgi:hypothetical protein
MLTEDVLASVRSAPKVGGSWEDCNTCGNGIKFYAEGMFRRRQLWPEPTWMVAGTVQPSTPGPGWLWSIGYGVDEQGSAPSAEEAMQAADAALRGRNWRLF